MTTIGEWQLEQELASGDFGTVSRVSKGPVIGAMKLATGANGPSRARLLVECDALERLNHPRIPRVLHNGVNEDPPHFVMDLVPGTTVSKRIEKWDKRGRVHGAKEAASILESLLEVLAHVNEAGMVHRDIKDANIMLDGESVYLIDFGFCKPSGSSDMRTGDSFWRAGAARFSPLSKLDDPTMAVPSHDLYAAGVLGYRLLTGAFPWTVTESDGVGALKNLIHNTNLVQPHEVNSLVPLHLSRFVSSLLVQDDSKRMQPPQALAEIRRICADLDSSTPNAPGRFSLVSQPHVIRDQVHGDVRLSDLEYKVFNTREMQRLRWIKQLGLTNFAYPGAEHSRLSHSIGTLDRVETIFRAIEDETGTRVDAETRRIARLYALTHDVSHIAFGHTIEDELGFFTRHDRNVERFDRLIRSPESELGCVLRESDIGKAVVDLLDPTVESDPEGLIVQSVSGVMGADVLDYVDRDAINCGLNHRVDTALFRQIRFYNREDPDSPKFYSNTGGKYGIRSDRLFAVESLLSERYALFLKVYTHSAKIAADTVLSKALTIRRGPRNNGLQESAIEWYGDEVLINSLATYNRQPEVALLGTRLRTRRLPKAAFRARLLTNEQLDDKNYNDVLSIRQRDGSLTPEGRAGYELRIAKESGIDASRVFVYLPSSAPGYKRVRHWSSSSPKERPQLESPQHGIEIGRRHLGLWEAWVFVSDAKGLEHKRVSDAAESVLQLRNMIKL